VRKSEEEFYKNDYKSRVIVFGNGNVKPFQTRTLSVQELNKLETLRKKFLGVFFVLILQ